MATTQHTPNHTTVPVRHHHPGAAKTATSPATRPEGAIPTGAEVRALVEWAVKERSRAICRGWSRVDHAFVQSQMIPLQVWLQRNPHPGTETLRLLRHERLDAIRLVMPSNAAGMAKLHRLTEILAAL